MKKRIPIGFEDLKEIIDKNLYYVDKTGMIADRSGTIATRFENTSLSSQCQSIFTGLNNLEIYSVMNPWYADCFGFTEKEVKEMLSCYGLESKFPELQQWYDGYRFGDAEIYNPWSILNYVKMGVKDQNIFPKPYWSNTSSNSIIRELVEHADMATRQEIELLIAGGTSCILPDI